MTKEYLFEQLHNKYGSHHEAAKALGVSVKTYVNWRCKGFRRRSSELGAIAIMKEHLSKKS